MNPASIRNQVRIPIFGGKTSAEIFSFSGLCDGEEHIALGLGDYKSAPIPAIRIHSECLTGDVFASAKCDCGPQLLESMTHIEQRGGFLLYLRQEGRGIGLYNKIDAYVLQQAGLDTYSANQALGFPADMRDFRAAAEMLKALGVSRIELLSNNPRKEKQLREYGIEITRTSSTGTHVNPSNAGYLQTKRDVGGHRLARTANKVLGA